MSGRWKPWGKPKNQEHTTEFSRAGHPILRHEAVDRPLEPPEIDEVVRTALGAHIESYLGPSSFVWHEVISIGLHIDVMVWPPTPDRPMYTLMTQGMSERPMNVPPALVDAGVPTRAELMLCLPPTWRMPTAEDPSAWDDPDAFFPVRNLKTLARIPYDYNSWLGLGHTVPNGDPPEPFTTETKLCGWVLLPPIKTPNGLHTLTVDGVGTIAIWGMVALHADELQHKLDYGVESLFDGFDAARVSELLDLNRPSSLTVR